LGRLRRRGWRYVDTVLFAPGPGAPWSAIVPLLVGVVLLALNVLGGWSGDRAALVASQHSIGRLAGAFSVTTRRPEPEDELWHLTVELAAASDWMRRDSTGLRPRPHEC
jgi:hypothetical protein